MAGDYSGNAAFLRSLTDGLTPDPLMTVAEWADTYRILSGTRPFSAKLRGDALPACTSRKPGVLWPQHFN
jgi:hypothetical protein